MKLKTLTIASILIGLFLSGCGQKEEIQPTNESTQTRALVPGSVSEKDLNKTTEMTDLELEQVAETKNDPVAAAAIPVNNEPVNLEEELASPSTQTPAGEVSRVAETVPAGNNSGRYSLQLGSFTVLAIAEEKAAQLRKMGYWPTIERAEVGGQLYHRLFIRGLADRQSAEKLGEDLHTSLGLSYLVKRK